MEGARVEVAVEPVEVRGRHGIWVTTTAPAADEEAYEAQFDALEHAFDERGLEPGDAVRSRLTAASRPGRDVGSVVRLRRQAAPQRTVTSSYIDASRFPNGDGTMLETLALEGAAADKLAVENTPSPPPWRVVATGNLAFFSGITSFADTLDDQLAEMAGLVARAVRLAEELTGHVVQPFAAAMYVRRGLDLAAMGNLGERLGLDGVAHRVARCDGFSFPSKLIEVEIDAEVGGSP